MDPICQSTMFFNRISQQGLLVEKGLLFIFPKIVDVIFSLSSSSNNKTEQSTVLYISTYIYISLQSHAHLQSDLKDLISQLPFIGDIKTFLDNQDLKNVHKKYYFI